MTAYKLFKGNKFAYCDDCYMRVNRVYQREKKSGVFKGFAWFCNRCNTFTLDKDVKNLS